jgi:hypothetical protein
MTSFRQIDANRRNAQRSTGPITQEGKKKSRRNAVRHGLTAETVIDELEDAEDYAAFEMAITADYDAHSAAERELVLRLASVLWRLRRATAIESGLFEIQAQQGRRGYKQRQKISDNFLSNAEAAVSAGSVVAATDYGPHRDIKSVRAGTGQFDDITKSYIRLTNLPTFPLDRLTRYEAALWRQACQLIFTLRFLNRDHRRIGFRYRGGRLMQRATCDGS